MIQISDTARRTLSRGEIQELTRRGPGQHTLPSGVTVILLPSPQGLSLQLTSETQQSGCFG